ncbi:EAL domain-containing protein [Rahnella sp. EDr1-12]|uniref:EAL domain-containing protein n=1 Tax=unclassified Rahnella TaxID=2635087 RepID=UPI003BAC7BB4
MLKLCIAVETYSIAEPITSTKGKLLGVELLTRIDTGGITESEFDMEYFIARLTEDSKRSLLLSQLEEVQAKAQFFIEYRLLCSINIDFDMAQIILKDTEVSTLLGALPFVRLEISERFPNLSDGMKNPLLKELSQRYPLWLDDLGAGNANLEALQSGVFECVKVDKRFYWNNCNSLMWPIIIKNISQYCDQIIIEGVENQHQLSKISQGITGIQGYIYKSVPFSKVETLI